MLTDQPEDLVSKITLSRAKFSEKSSINGLYFYTRNDHRNFVIYQPSSQKNLGISTTIFRIAKRKRTTAKYLYIWQIFELNNTSYKSNDRLSASKSFPSFSHDHSVYVIQIHMYPK